MSLQQRDNFSGTSGIWTYVQTGGTVSVAGGELRMLKTTGSQNDTGAYLTNTFVAADGDNMEASIYQVNPDNEFDFFQFTKQPFTTGQSPGFLFRGNATYAGDGAVEVEVDTGTGPVPTSAPGQVHRVQLTLAPAKEYKYYVAGALEHTTASGTGDINTGNNIRCRFVSNYYDPQELRAEYFARWTADDRNPPPPTDLTATAQGTDSILLGWTDVVTAINGDDIRIEMDDGGGFTEIDSEILGVGQFLVSGLGPDTEYDFRIRSRADVGGTDYYSAYSVTATETTDAEPSTGGTTSKKLIAMGCM